MVNTSIVGTNSVGCELFMYLNSITGMKDVKKPRNPQKALSTTPYPLKKALHPTIIAVTPPTGNKMVVVVRVITSSRLLIPKMTKSNIQRAQSP